MLTRCSYGSAAMPLIRARSVVQVHPGPPFKSAVNTRLFSLFPFSWISLKKPFCHKFAKNRLSFGGNHPGRSPEAQAVWTSCVSLVPGNYSTRRAKAYRGLQAETESVVLETMYRTDLKGYGEDVALLQVDTKSAHGQIVRS
jgi:hypothetical protein